MFGGGLFCVGLVRFSGLVLLLLDSCSGFGVLCFGCFYVLNGFWLFCVVLDVVSGVLGLLVCSAFGLIVFGDFGEFC